MPTSELTCAEVEERGLEASWLAGRLSPQDAEAYELHYFGCDRCWASLKRATELRAAFAAAPAVVGPMRRNWFRPGLAAAAMIVVALGGWLAYAQLASRDTAGTTRGSADSLLVRSSRTGAALGAAWQRVAGADRYRVRLYAADGTLLFERETPDSTLALAADSVPRAARMFWQVQALDALRQPLARSPLTPAESPPVP